MKKLIVICIIVLFTTPLFAQTRTLPNITFPASADDRVRTLLERYPVGCKVPAPTSTGACVEEYGLLKWISIILKNLGIEEIKDIDREKRKQAFKNARAEAEATCEAENPVHTDYEELFD